MCNWLQKMFGLKCNCGHCCCGDEKCQPKSDNSSTKPAAPQENAPQK